QMSRQMLLISIIIADCAYLWISSVFWIAYLKDFPLQSTLRDVLLLDRGLFQNMYHLLPAQEHRIRVTFALGKYLICYNWIWIVTVMVLMETVMFSFVTGESA